MGQKWVKNRLWGLPEKEVKNRSKHIHTHTKKENPVFFTYSWPIFRKALSGSHRSTHIASDLALPRSHRRPNRNGSPNCRHFPSLDLRKHHGRASQANIAGFLQKEILAFSCDFRSSYWVFASLEKMLFRIASDWECAIRIASHIAVALRDLGQ